MKALDERAEASRAGLSGQFIRCTAFGIHCKTDTPDVRCRQLSPTTPPEVAQSSEGELGDHHRGLGQAIGHEQDAARRRKRACHGVPRCGVSSISLCCSVTVDLTSACFSIATLTDCTKVCAALVK